MSKKLIMTLCVSVAAVSALTGCGHSRNLANSPYLTGEGEGLYGYTDTGSLQTSRKTRQSR